MPIGPFEYRWPEGFEKFKRGWECVAVVDGRDIRVRHGLGRRRVYGATRVHSVTWVHGLPSVEGVQADDYLRSRALVSLLRQPDKRMVRRDADVPLGYDAFTVVNHQDEIRATHSRSGLAVKIAEDDIAAWATHAIIRAATFGRLHSRASQATPPSEVRTAGAVSRTSPREVVRTLLHYADSIESAALKKPSFTPDRAANSLILTDPFAFLLAVIFDQGIAAERAWRAPYELKRRLGHLNPRRIEKEGVRIAKAVQGPPSLHRFTRKIADWVVSAAGKVAREYGGNAGAIWAAKPTARELQARLQKFDGIGQKKAAMAVEILERDLRVPIVGMEGSDVAYDIHVRRVFLRTGLAKRDEPAHMIDVTRRLYPARPGKLDYVAWRVGRSWCHAGTPECGKCVLQRVCPKELSRAADVRAM